MEDAPWGLPLPKKKLNLQTQLTLNQSMVKF